MPDRVPTNTARASQWLGSRSEAEVRALPAETFFFDPTRLDALAERLRSDYASASPFPHVVIDDLLPPRVLCDVLEEFPGPREVDWQRFQTQAERKLATNVESNMRAATRHLLAQFNSSAVCGFLEKLTGIGGVIPDPHFVGGGLHQIERNGFLKVHADFNWYERLRLDRRINLLLYLNEDWREEYGGHLELWDRNMERCVQRILPIFNRCVIFNTTSDAYHGHPDPLTCPEGRARRSLALYYYTRGRPEEERRGVHSTLFQARAGSEDPRGRELWTARDLIKQLTPPIVVDMGRNLRRAIRRRRER
jgi:hypothetical protein